MKCHNICKAENSVSVLDVGHRSNILKYFEVKCNCKIFVWTYYHKGQDTTKHTQHEISTISKKKAEGKEKKGPVAKMVKLYPTQESGGSRKKEKIWLLLLPMFCLL